MADQWGVLYFNPRAPRGARLPPRSKCYNRSAFQSTCPARGTTLSGLKTPRIGSISIHVPREGHDGVTSPDARLQRSISIHVPREGHDFCSSSSCLGSLADFNPRAPRGARPGRVWTSAPSLRNFNPRAPRGARPSSPTRQSALSNFNPRAPRGARRAARRPCSTMPDFNPRAPRGARQQPFGNVHQHHQISIHVPREGHDLSRAPSVDFWDLYFNPRAPRGARPCRAGCWHNNRNFNPRAPRGARRPYSFASFSRPSNFNPRAPRGARPTRLYRKYIVLGISIHVPREGHDSALPAAVLLPFAHFNPRAPRGARPAAHRLVFLFTLISIHVPREGHDHMRRHRQRVLACISIHVPREGHDTIQPRVTGAVSYFNPRAPRGARPFLFKPRADLKSFQSTCPARGTTH